jgi:hypothetical protein
MLSHTDVRAVLSNVQSSVPVTKLRAEIEDRTNPFPRQPEASKGEYQAGFELDMHWLSVSVPSRHS